MKLLIADDEKNIRNGLLSLPWNTIGIDQTYQAENGLEALEIRICTESFEEWGFGLYVKAPETKRYFVYC